MLNASDAVVVNCHGQIVEPGAPLYPHAALEQGAAAEPVEAQAEAGETTNPPVETPDADPAAKASDADPSQPKGGNKPRP
jgi:hypothetical protein